MRNHSQVDQPVMRDSGYGANASMSKARRRRGCTRASSPLGRRGGFSAFLLTRVPVKMAFNAAAPLVLCHDGGQWPNSVRQQFS